MKWTGLQEYKAALRALPEELKDEAFDIVLGASQAAMREIYNRYPVGPTGNLRKGLRILVDLGRSTRLGVFVRLYNAAPHAYLFEVGTAPRRTATGAKRGSMPPGRVFVPIVIRHRHVMRQALIALVRSKGLLVRAA